MKLRTMLCGAAERRGTVTVIDSSGRAAMSWADLHEESTRGAAWLLQRGIGRGQVVMLVGRTSLDLIIAIRSAWLAGSAVAVAPAPLRDHRREVFRERLTALRQHVSASLVLGDAPYLSGSMGESGTRVMAIDDWRREVSTTGTVDTAELSSSSDPDDIAIVQLTSGTTETPRAVLVPRRCLVANHLAIAKGLRLQTNDVFMSWLPLSHDMGLIGMLGVPMTHGADLVIADPGVFIGEPHLWMEWCSESAATITCGPSSMYSLATRYLHRERSTVDLSMLRLAVNGAEPVDVEAFQAFFDIGKQYGLDPSAAFPVYGLAEATLAVTFPTPGEGLTWDDVDWDSICDGYATPSTGGSGNRQRLAILGRPLEGISLRIANDGASLGERSVGNVQMTGESVTPGYVSQRPFDSGEDDWFDTGDLGYLVEGQLVICGREKDVIIVGGRNVYPEMVETVIGKVDGVCDGGVAVFGVRESGTERPVAIVETATQSGQLQRAISIAVLEECDVRLADAHLVGPKTVPKTTSGKIARRKCRELYEEGAL